MSLSRYSHLIGFALDTEWAVTPRMARIVAGILADRLGGVASDPAAIQAALAIRKDSAPVRRGAVAGIPIYGVIAPRANLLTEASGGTSCEAIGASFQAALDDPSVDTILLDIDSPGGSAAGIMELAGRIRAARAVKPVVAVANYMCCSAAYWLAANATKFYASPSADVGSIGVVTMHDDLTEALAKVGVKREYISAGKYKLEASAPGPLTDDARAYIQARVDAVYQRFVDDVAKGRGVKRADVLNGYGEGRVVSADAALAAGMIDGIQSLDDTIAKLLPTRTPGGDARTHLALTNTPQEPSPATGQDSPRDDWQARIERDLLALSLP